MLPARFVLSKRSNIISTYKIEYMHYENQYEIGNTFHIVIRGHYTDVSAIAYKIAQDIFIPRKVKWRIVSIDFKPAAENANASECITTFLFREYIFGGLNK